MGLPRGDSGTQAPSFLWLHPPLEPQKHLLSAGWGKNSEACRVLWIFMENFMLGLEVSQTTSVHVPSANPRSHSIPNCKEGWEV